MLSLKSQNIIKYIPIINFIVCVFSLLRCLSKYQATSTYKTKVLIKLICYGLLTYLPYMLLYKVIGEGILLTVVCFVSVYLVMFVVACYSIGVQKRLGAKA